VVNFTAWMPEEGTRYPLNSTLGEPQNRYGYLGEETNILTLPGIETKITWSSIL